MNERQIQSAILLRIGGRPFLRIWRQNVGVARAISSPEHVIKFGINGAADLTGILACGRRLEIEVKTPKGRQSANQRRYQAMIEQFGGLYFVADSPDAAEGFLALHLQSCKVCRSAEPWQTKQPRCPSPKTPTRKAPNGSG